MKNLLNTLKKNKFPVLLSGGVLLGSLSLWKLWKIYKNNNQNPPHPLQPKPAPEVQDVILTDQKYKIEYPLEREAAFERSQIISDVKYQIILLLLKGDHYQGISRIQFNALQKKDTFIDFQGKCVKRFEVNGVKIVDQDAYQNHRLKLKAELLKTDCRNKVVVHYHNEYRNDSIGIHHFIDPQDNEEYIYTQCEPSFAHKIFPVFDQPNLKAKMRMMTLAPTEWEVFSNYHQVFSSSLEKNVSHRMVERHKIQQLVEITRQEGLAPQDVTFKIFDQTPSISPYLYALAAGPWHVFESKKENYPDLRIMCRKTLANSVYAEQFFQVTRAGMDYYQDFFGVPYVFKKYDQIFCPQYKYGAMENVGLVTYTEHYCFKQKPSYSSLMRFFCTVLHELAHMWFGNYVTMEWWDDLWLNQSFATYMSHLALAYAKGIRPEWQESSWDLFLTQKAWGYAEDQLSTTHPISCDIRNTDEAQSNFDGITYAKGSAFLKQLANYIGLQNFRDGCRLYFKRHGYGNTRLQDFINALDQNLKENQGMDKNLHKFCDMWLKTSGLNTVVPKFSLDSYGEEIQSFKIVQNFSKFGDKVLRTHKLDIGIFDEHWNEIVIQNVTIAANQPQTEIKQVVQQKVKGPKAVYLNINDHAFVKVVIDDYSMIEIKRNIKNVKNRLTRRMIWQSVWQMVKDNKLSSIQFLELIEDNLLEETIDETLLVMLARISTVCSHYLPPELKEQFFDRMMKFGQKLLVKHQKNQDLTILILDRIVSLFHNDSQVGLAIQWVTQGVHNDKGQLLAFGKLTNRQRYRILPYIFSRTGINFSKKNQILDLVLDKDKSDEADRLKISCRSALPDPKIKQEEWQKFMDKDNKESLYNLNASMSGFMHWDNQLDILGEYIDKWLDGLLAYGENFERERAEHFHDSLNPTSFLIDARGDEIFARFEEMIKVVPEANYMRQKLKEDLDLMVCWRDARRLAAKYYNDMKSQ